MADLREEIVPGLDVISYPFGAEAVSVSANETFPELDRAVTVIYDGYRSCTKCATTISRTCRHMKVYNHLSNPNSDENESDGGDAEFMHDNLFDSPCPINQPGIVWQSEKWHQGKTNGCSANLDVLHTNALCYCDMETDEPANCTCRQCPSCHDGDLVEVVNEHETVRIFDLSKYFDVTTASVICSNCQEIFQWNGQKIGV